MDVDQIEMMPDEYDAEKIAVYLGDPTTEEHLIVGGLAPKIAARLQRMLSDAVSDERLREEELELYDRIDEIRESRRRRLTDPRPDYEEREDAFGRTGPWDTHQSTLNFDSGMKQSTSGLYVPTSVVPYTAPPVDLKERETRVRQAVSQMKMIADKIIPGHITLLVRRGNGREVLYTSVIQGGADPRFEVPDEETLGEVFDRGGKTAIDGLLKYFVQKVAPEVQKGSTDTPELSYTY